MNDKAFTPPILDAPDPQSDETYAQVAIVIAGYAARHGGAEVALELGAVLGLPPYSYDLAKYILMEKHTW